MKPCYLLSLFFMLFACQAHNPPAQSEEDNELTNNSENTNEEENTEEENTEEDLSNQSDLENDFNIQNSNNMQSNAKGVTPNVKNAAVKTGEPKKEESPITVTQEPTKQPLEDEANSNHKRFVSYFSNLLGGHPEGNYIVNDTSCPIYESANVKGQIVGYLQSGDLVHGFRKSGEFLQIGMRKYVQQKSLQSRRGKTPGSEKYKNAR